jgi:oligopeptide transport system permease protein
MTEREAQHPMASPVPVALPQDAAAMGTGDLALAYETGVEMKARSQWAYARMRFFRHRLAVAGLVVLLLAGAVAVFAPQVAPYGYDEIPFTDPEALIENPNLVQESINRGPTLDGWHLFGTDQLGRDYLSRVIFGVRTSLWVALFVALLSTAFGAGIGAVAGYFGGAVDNVLMRAVDVIYAIPQLLLVLLLVNWRGPGLVNIFLAIGLVGWVTEARLVRGSFLALREQEFVNAARVAGGGSLYIILRHVLPNSLTPIIVALTFGIPTAIFTEAALSYVGVGILPPQASWGQMVGEGSQAGYVQSDPHMLFFPVLAIGLTMLGFTFLGDGLRDALDPKGND